MSLVVKEMAVLHRTPSQSFDPELFACIEKCVTCFQACAACADACLAEPDVSSLVKCIRVDLDCSDLCATTAAMLTRRTEIDLAVIRSAIGVCLAACVACAEECERHAMHHEHCRVCAEVCRQCEAACRQLLGVLPTAD